MINRLLVLAAATLGAVAIGVMPYANVGGLTGADAARAQVPAPPADPDAGLDDTAVGGLDQSDLSTPLDETNLAPRENPAPPAPPAGTPGPGTGGSPTGSPLSVYVIINVPTGTNGKATPKRNSANKKRQLARKRKLARKCRALRKHPHAHQRRLARRCHARR